MLNMLGRWVEGANEQWLLEEVEAIPCAITVEKTDQWIDEQKENRSNLTAPMVGVGVASGSNMREVFSSWHVNVWQGFSRRSGLCLDATRRSNGKVRVICFLEERK
jgi:hypothetical protein